MCAVACGVWLPCRYSLREYAMVVLVTAGIALFQMKSKGGEVRVLRPAPPPPPTINPQPPALGGLLSAQLSNCLRVYLCLLHG